MNQSKRELFVGGINSAVSNDQLSSYFNSFGLLDSFKRPIDRRTGRNREFAFISFSDPTVFDGKFTIKYVYNIILKNIIDLKQMDFIWYI